MTLLFMPNHIPLVLCSEAVIFHIYIKISIGTSNSLPLCLHWWITNSSEIDEKAFNLKLCLLFILYIYSCIAMLKYFQE